MTNTTIRFLETLIPADLIDDYRAWKEAQLDTLLATERCSEDLYEVWGADDFAREPDLAYALQRALESEVKVEKYKRIQSIAFVY